MLSSYVLSIVADDRTDAADFLDNISKVIDDLGAKSAVLVPSMSRIEMTNKFQSRSTLRDRSQQAINLSNHVV